MSDWKDIDKNTPLDVLINMMKYQIQMHSTHDGYRDTEIIDEVQLFEKINNRFLKYRYRLKPLEPMKITKELNDYLFNNCCGGVFNNGIAEKLYNRKVEIID